MGNCMAWELIGGCGILAGAKCDHVQRCHLCILGGHAVGQSLQLLQDAAERFGANRVQVQGCCLCVLTVKLVLALELTWMRQNKSLEPFLTVSKQQSAHVLKGAPSHCHPCAYTLSRHSRRREMV